MIKPGPKPSPEIINNGDSAICRASCNLWDDCETRLHSTNRNERGVPYCIPWVDAEVEKRDLNRYVLRGLCRAAEALRKEGRL